MRAEQWKIKILCASSGEEIDDSSGDDDAIRGYVVNNNTAMEFRLNLGYVASGDEHSREYSILLNWRSLMANET